MNSKELKKCPFCGGEAEVQEFPDTFDSCGWSTTVICKNCGAEVMGDEDKAIERWNRRATPNELREREQEIRIGILFRLARFIQRKVKLWVGCDVDEDITTIGLSLRVGDGYIHRLEQVNRREQTWRINKEIPALKFSGKEFLEALMDKSRKE